MYFIRVILNEYVNRQDWINGLFSHFGITNISWSEGSLMDTLFLVNLTEENVSSLMIYDIDTLLMSVFSMDLWPQE